MQARLRLGVRLSGAVDSGFGSRITGSDEAMKGRNAWWRRRIRWRREAGLRLLAEGGNAFDAAAATAVALNVAEPFMSGLAGIGQATCFVAAEQRVRVLDFVTRAPRASGRGPTATARS